MNTQNPPPQIDSLTLQIPENLETNNNVEPCETEAKNEVLVPLNSSLKDRLRLDYDPDDVPVQLSAYFTADFPDDSKETKGMKSTGTSFVARVKRFRGLGFVVLSCMAFSLGGLIAKYFKEYHAFSKCLWRFQGLLLPAIPIMLFMRFGQEKLIFEKILPVREGDNGKNVGFLLLRATTGFAAIFFQFHSYKYITLADNMVVMSSVPVFVTIFAYLLLGEKFGYVQFILCGVTILGVGVVARPPFLTGAKEFDKDILIGSGFAVIAMLMAVLTIVFTRRMKKLPFILITFTYGLCSTIYSLAFAIPMGVLQFPQGRFEVFLCILFAGLAFISQVSMTLALKYEQAGPVSLVRTSNIAFAFLWQYIFLGVIPDRFSVLGALIIALAVILTAVRKWIDTLPEQHALKTRFSLLLR